MTQHYVSCLHSLPGASKSGACSTKRQKYHSATNDLLCGPQCPLLAEAGNSGPHRKVFGKASSVSTETQVPAFGLPLIKTTKVASLPYGYVESVATFWLMKSK